MKSKSCNYTPITTIRASRFQGVPLLWLLVSIYKKYALTPTPPAGREPDYLRQRAQWALLSSGGHGGTWSLLPGVVQCARRSLLGNRPARHLTIAILVALGEGAFRAPHPASLASTVFGVRVAAFAQLNIALAKLDDEQAVQLEVQQRLWLSCGRTTPAAPTGGAGHI